MRTMKVGAAVYFCSLSAVTPAEHVKIAIDAVQQFRRGDRPWAGDRVAGTAQARSETGQDETKVDDAAPITSAALESKEVSAEEQAVDEIFEAVLDHEDVLTVELVNKALGRGVSVHKILDDALIAAMDEVGEDFSKGVIFVPEMLMAARAMKAGLEVLRPILTATGEPPKGKVMLATVQGDVHDIGKNLVGMMLEGAGYEVVELGVNATPEDILESAHQERPDVVGLSALLTTSMPSMQKTLKLFRDKGAPYPVIIGGAPVTQDFAHHIGADGYGRERHHGGRDRAPAGGPGSRGAHGRLNSDKGHDQHHHRLRHEVDHERPAEGHVHWRRTQLCYNFRRDAASKGLQSGRSICAPAKLTRAEEFGGERLRP